MTIDIQSLILGMGLVLVIAFAIGGVVALVKVIRLERNSNNIGFGTQQQIDGLHTHLNTKMNEIQNQFGGVYKDMDSRIDKIYNKIMQETNPKHRILNMINGGLSDPTKTDNNE